MTRLPALLLIVLLCACNHRPNTSQPKPSTLDSIFYVEGFDTATNYSDATCLLYKGKPLLLIGEQVNKLAPKFAFRKDTAGKYVKYPKLVTDYLSSDRFYSAKLTTGNIDGTLYFSADSNGRIFRLNGSWVLNADLADTAGMEILGYLQNHYLPCVSQVYKTGETLELTHKNFRELLRLNPSPNAAVRDHGYQPNWSLDYSIVLKRNDSL